MGSLKKKVRGLVTELCAVCDKQFHKVEYTHAHIVYQQVQKSNTKSVFERSSWGTLMEIESKSHEIEFIVEFPPGFAYERDNRGSTILFSRTVYQYFLPDVPR
jgi:hypothetical protein